MSDNDLLHPVARGRAGSFIDRLVPEALQSDPEKRRRARLLILIALAGFVWGPVFAPIHFFVGRTPGASLALLIAGLSTALVPLVLRKTGSLAIAANALCLILLAIVAEVTFVRGGFPVSALMWICVVPMIALFLLGRRAGIAWAAIVTLSVAGFGVFTLVGSGLEVRMSERQMLIIDVAGVLAFFALMMTVMWLYDTERRSSMEAVQAANRAKSEFLARMSHEVRTPMNGVLGTIDLLAASSLSISQRENVALVRESARQLLRIVTEILEFSTLEKGAVRLVEERFDPREEIRAVTDLFVAEALEKGIELTSELREPVPVALLGDAGRLRQVIVNLVSNALKFTDQGQVRIVASGRPGHDGFVLRIDISDTGCGIAPEDMKKIFQPFSRVDESLSRCSEGGGLGLSISSELISLMGGRLWAESAPGVGSMFSLAVPFGLPKRGEVAATRDEGVPALARVTEETKERRSGRRVLLAEDNPINKKVTLAMLRGLGYQADVASTGREAIDLALRGRYDLVLMDCQMPEMDGYQATEQLRALPELERVPIVALTAHALASDRRQCLAVGMDDYLSKPIDSADLEAVLTRWIR